MGDELAEDGMAVVPADGTLRVRYTGTSNHRVLTKSDLSGETDGAWMQLVWSPGSEIDWDYWLDLAGSEERARSVLNAHKHEFELVGPGAEEFFAEGGDEFDVGGETGE